MAMTRVTVTLPKELVKTADRRAREQERSRSWVIAEALRGYLGAGARPAPAVREPPVHPYHPGSLDEFRLGQLQRDLALTPERRVLEGEASVRLAERFRPGPRSRYVRFFATYPEYLNWLRLTHGFG